MEGNIIIYSKNEKMKCSKKIKVRVKNLDRTFELEQYTHLTDVLSLVEKELGFKPINATINNVTSPLDETLHESCEVNFMGLEYDSAGRTYFRTLFMILSKALSELFPTRKLIAEHSVSRGYYATVTEMESFTKENINQLKEKALQIIQEDHPITREVVPTEEVIRRAKLKGLQPIVDLLETTGSLYTTIHKIGDYADVCNETLMTHTGAVYLFDLIPFLDGILIRVPDKNDPSHLAPMVLQQKMQYVIKEQDRLLAMLGLSWVGSVNKAILSGKVKEMIQVSEALQEKQIAGIASRIALRYQEGVRLVLISGPSSSGKTTFTNRLKTQLLTNFIRPYMISLDDYFIEREYTPLDEEGNYDFESLYALDLDLFSEDMERLMRGETVAIPTYNFVTGKREYIEGKELTLQDGDILMLEGIHALNPELLPNVDPRNLYKVYVSALTALGIDEHNPISTTSHRLLRRIIRDHSFRGYTARDTIEAWHRVRRGEDRWVFPYQEYSDDMFNSSMVYEMAVIRPIAEPLLLDVPEGVPEYTEARRLLKLLRYNRIIPSSEIPRASLLREFVGGSVFYS